MGIKQLTVNGEKKDYLHIKYAGEDMLYVPVEQMDIVQKYTGSDSAVPKINSLSGGEWKKTKGKGKGGCCRNGGRPYRAYRRKTA